MGQCNHETTTDLPSGCCFCSAPSERRRFRRGITRIIGGSNAAVGELPYIATLQDTAFSEPWDICAGAIINQNYVLTAGHCVAGDDFNNPSNLQVVVGDVSKATVESSEQTIKLSKIKRHDNYLAYFMDNDLALLKVSSAIKFDSNVNKIDICTSSKAPNSGSCIAAGWGQTSETLDSYSTVLQKVTLPIVAWDTCARNYDDADQNDYDTRLLESMMCAGATGKDTCQGDAGGPLVCNNKLTGVASWGYGCGRPNYPEVYADVCYNHVWIQNNAV